MKNRLVKSAVVAGALLSGVMGGTGAALAGPDGEGFFYTYKKQPLPVALDGTRIAVFSEAEAIAGAAGRGGDAAWTERAEALGFDAGEASPMAVRGWASVPVALGVERGGDGLRGRVAGLAADPTADFVSPVFENEYGPIVITRDLIIGFYDDITREEADRVIAAEGLGEILERDFQGMRGVYRVRSVSRDGFVVLDDSNRVSLRPEIRFAEPDMIMTNQRHLIPNDPAFPQQWGLHNTGQTGGLADMDMNGPEAWDLTTGDPSVLVVVIDDGVDLAHLDLNIGAGIDFTGIGTAGNHDPNNPCDSHGTLVAGCISAKINNNFQGTGIAPNARVAAAKFSISNQPCSGNGTFQISWMTGSINWSTTIGARVTNNSNGFGQSSAIDQAYLDTKNAGVIHFASTGNGGGSSIGYPSSSPSVNAVGAITHTGVRASFSQFGTGIAFSAPGQAILTTARGGGMSSVNGTSFSSPYAAGVAALVFSWNSFLTGDDVELIMQQSTKDLGAAGYDTIFGWGLVDAAAAIALAPVASPPGAFGLAYPGEGETNVPQLANFQWSASNFAQSYHIEVADNPAFMSPIIDTPVIGPSYQVMAPPLPVSTVLYWRVTAINTLGSIGSTPAMASFTTLTDPPGAFTLTAPADGAMGVSLQPNLSWAAAPLATSYRVRVDDDPAFGSPAVDTITSATSMTILSSLSPSTTFYWTVDAQNAIGSTVSTPSSRSFGTVGLPPGMFNLTSPGDGLNVNTRTPTLMWSTASGADSYSVVVAEDLGLATVVHSEPTVLGTSFQVPNGVLINGERYYWQVIAHNGAGTRTSSPAVASFGVLVPPCQGDANDDGLINFSDITSVLSNWGTSGPLGDADHNGSVDFVDITAILSRWGLSCP